MMSSALHVEIQFSRLLLKVNGKARRRFEILKVS